MKSNLLETPSTSAHRRTPRARLAALVVASIATLAGLSSTARAENPLLDDAPPVLRTRPLLDGRHIIAPQFGATLGDPYVRNLMAGVYYRYHLTSWLGLGADVWVGGGVDTKLTDDINAELSRPDQPFAISTTSIRFLANAVLELVPLSGKAILFSDALVRVDLHIDVGIGVAMVAGGDRIDDSASLSPMFGVGVRIFPSRWLSIGVDIKDYFINRALASSRDGSVPEATFGQNWLFGLSIGFSFPTNPAIETGN